MTLTDILKMFNPDLKGASHGIALSTDPEAGLNKAEPDAESRYIKDRDTIHTIGASYPMVTITLKVPT